MFPVITEDERQLLDLLLNIPPKFDEAAEKIHEMCLSSGSITKVGILYAEECYLDWEEAFEKAEPCNEITPGLHSSYMLEVMKFLLDYGLDPNAVFDKEGRQSNLMCELLFVDHAYIAADTMALLMEHGGNPNLIVDGESIFEQVDFEIWFGSIEQYTRWRYDECVHIWMVLVAYGGEIAGKGPMVKTFRDYCSGEMFDLAKLKNHRDYYYGLSMEDGERMLYVYDKKTRWKVAQW